MRCSMDKVIIEHMAQRYVAEFVAMLEKNAAGELLVINVKSCARCGQDHEVGFMPFSKNGIDSFTHWGMCPVLGEPLILMALEDDANKEAKP